MRLIVPQRTHDQIGPAVVRVLALAGQGLSNQEIASCLTYDPTTIKNYMYRSARYFGTTHRTATVLAAMRQGLIPCPHHCRLGHPPRRKPRPGRRKL